MAKTKTAVKEETVLHTESERFVVWPSDIIEQFEYYSDMADQGEFGQAIVLSELRDDVAEIYKTYGFDSFKEIIIKHPSFVNRVGVRKAYFLADIGDFMRKHKLTISDMAHLNLTWTKARELVQVAESKSELTALVKVTKDLNVQETHDYVVNTKAAKSGGETTIKKKVTMNFIDEQGKIWDEFVEVCMARYSVDIPEAAVIGGLMEFLAQLGNENTALVSTIIDTLKKGVAKAEAKPKRSKETKPRKTTKSKKK